MKKLERIFLYTVLAILVFYVFLVDGNIESQVAIQEEIRARSILIVNDAGQEVVQLWANEDGGLVNVCNKDGTPVVEMGVHEDYDSGLIVIRNKNDIPVALMGVNKDGNGMMGVGNKNLVPVTLMAVDEDGNGMMGVTNKNDIPIVVIRVDEYDDSGLIAVYNNDGEKLGSLP